MAKQPTTRIVITVDDNVEVDAIGTMNQCMIKLYKYADRLEADLGCRVTPCRLKSEECEGLDVRYKFMFGIGCKVKNKVVAEIGMNDIEVL